MKEPSIGVKLAVAAGFIMSGGALYWLVKSPPRPREILFRVGWVSAVFCALAVLSFCWAVFVADIAVKRDWSSRTCVRAGIPLSLLGFFLAILDSRFWPLACMMGTINMAVAFFARRLAYPHMTDEQAAAPEPPLSLFQK
jgi:hypothetical protein